MRWLYLIQVEPRSLQDADFLNAVVKVWIPLSVSMLLFGLWVLYCNISSQLKYLLSFLKQSICLSLLYCWAVGVWCLSILSHKYQNLLNSLSTRFVDNSYMFRFTAPIPRLTTPFPGKNKDNIQVQAGKFWTLILVLISLAHVGVCFKELIIWIFNAVLLWLVTGNS